MRSWFYETTPTERKLYPVFQARWRDMYEPEPRKPIIRIQAVVKDWEDHLISLGMGFSEGTDNYNPRAPGDKNHYVVDPASPLDEKYIVLPDELALKILALGDCRELRRAADDRD